MNSATIPGPAGDRDAAVPPVLLFSHANGFPAGTYRALFDVWRAAGYRVEALERFGHNPAYPVTSNWPHLVEELRDFARGCGVGRAYLVGHSLGGLLSLMAASRHPELAAGVVMLDSPFIAGWRAHSLHMIKASRLIQRVSPGRYSRRRRQSWADRSAVLTHFQSKANFARWDPSTLAAYVDCGFEDRDGEVRLAFDRSVETRIYNTLPHNLDTLLRRHPLRCGVGFIAGTQSVEVRQGGLAASRRLAQGHFRWMDGSHLFPMERPQETAVAVLQLLEELSRPGVHRLL